MRGRGALSPHRTAAQLASFFGLSALRGAGRRAVLTVIAANPIRGAMGLLMTFVGVAGLFLALHAQFLAAIQLIVYAGAIVVLFIFVIMLLGPDATPPDDGEGGVFALARRGRLRHLRVAHGRRCSSLARRRRCSVPAPTARDFGTIDAFGRELFTRGLVPFELSSALLIRWSAPSPWRAAIKATPRAAARASKHRRRVTSLPSCARDRRLRTKVVS